MTKTARRERKPGGPDDFRMSLGEHIDDLRGSLIRAILGIVVGMVICLIFGKYIMQVMCWPLAVAMRGRGMPPQLRTLAPAEAFLTYIKVCLIWGAILAGPYSLYQIWRFIAPGLYNNEQKYFRRYFPFSVGLFLLGVVFFFIVIAPMCLTFFLGFGADQFPVPDWGPALPNIWSVDDEGDTDDDAPAPGPVVIPVLETDPEDPLPGTLWINKSDRRVRFFDGKEVRALEPSPKAFLSAELRLGYYMTFVSWLSLVFGVGFQMPIVVLVLARSGVAPLSKMKATRKYIILILLVSAAILTPPDVISQVALAVPMYMLFELGLLLAARGQAKRDAASEARDADEEN